MKAKKTQKVPAKKAPAKKTAVKKAVKPLKVVKKSAVAVKSKVVKKEIKKVEEPKKAAPKAKPVEKVNIYHEERPQQQPMIRPLVTSKRLQTAEGWKRATMRRLGKTKT